MKVCNWFAAMSSYPPSVTNNEDEEGEDEEEEEVDDDEDGFGSITEDEDEDEDITDQVGNQDISNPTHAYL